jgi:hypothetical protein
MNSRDNQTPSLPNVEQSSDHHQSTIAAKECDFPDIDALTALKCCINYEFHREAALEGCEAAREWLEREYPGWNGLHWQKVPTALRQARIEALKERERFETLCHMTPTLEECKLITPQAYKLALASGPLRIPLPVEVTPKQLSKVEGLTEQRYQTLIVQRGSVAAELIILKRDLSLPTETILKHIRWFLEESQPAAPPINQEHGKSSTKRQLLVILKALIAYRLLGRGGLSVPKAVQTLELAGIKPPYTQNREQHWRNAQKLAARLLEELKAGRFQEAVVRFIATRQARKFFAVP